MRESGKLVIVSGGDDQVAKSAKIFNPSTEAFWQQKQRAVSIAVIPNALHEEPFLNPKIFIDTAEKKLNEKSKV